VGDWKLIRGCPGIPTDWYTLDDFNVTFDHPHEGIELAISFENNDETCLDESETAEKAKYFLFNLKGMGA
jgi:hypothetical protein